MVGGSCVHWTDVVRRSHRLSVAPISSPHRHGLMSVEVVLDVSWLADPDCRTVEALARLQLAARRGGRRIVLHGPCRELRELVALCGLSEVLPCAEASASGVEPIRQAEEREPARGVEEERDAGDPIA
jgi:ABC-type transporter Mla MlaB component